ncbi:MAG: hypothetical protein AAGM22_31945 [Acidobacteriota bacterium]
MAFGLFNTTVTASGMLEQMRGELDKRRRTADAGFLKAHRFKAPAWIAGDPLEACYAPEAHQALSQKGVLLWAHVVEAHDKLSKRGLRDQPASVVYSPHFDGNVLRAAEVSEAIRSLKKRGHDFGAAEITPGAARDRHFHRRVPEEIAGEQIMFFTELVIHRGLLPGRQLNGSFVPLLAQPQETVATMVLSRKYWPSALKRYWAA